MTKSQAKLHTVVLLLQSYGMTSNQVEIILERIEEYILQFIDDNFPKGVSQ
jgi:hypothetical protein